MVDTPPRLTRGHGIFFMTSYAHCSAAYVTRLRTCDDDMKAHNRSQVRSLAPTDHQENVENYWVTELSSVTDVSRNEA